MERRGQGERQAQGPQVDSKAADRLYYRPRAFWLKVWLAPESIGSPVLLSASMAVPRKDGIVVQTLKWPLIASFARLPLLGAIGMAALFALGRPLAFPPLVDLSALYFVAGNVVCYFLLRRALGKEGDSIRQLLGFSRDRWVRDVLWGLLWALVLYVPFVAALLGMLILLFGGDAFVQVASVFTPAASSLTDLPPWAGLLMAIAAAILFPITNAPIEELWYRGYAQPRIAAATGRPWAGILIPSLGFALQHILLAPTSAGMIVFAGSFFAWGLGAAIVYHYQRRLMPLIVAHFITNLFSGLVPLIIILTGAP